MNRLQERMLMEWKDTVSFYIKNPEKRAMLRNNGNMSGTCVYQTEEGNRCAVGRKMSNADIQRVMEAGSITSTIDRVWTLIKNPTIKRLPIEFWQDLQKFHDESGHWRTRGGVAYTITKKGLKFAEEIKKSILDGKYE